MEKGVDFLTLLREYFPAPPVDIRTYSPLTLAFLGDSVYELAVRTFIVDKGNRGVEAIHKEKSRYVKAQTQAQVAELLLELLTPEEETIYRRGRNTNIHSSAKSASMAEYRKATGLEALCGYLYLNGETERIIRLLQEGFRRAGLLPWPEYGL